ncbi:hypothetical protein COV19_01130 [Candidatus Woesearchaeota archaeon CG10_big_fil_rev_8_21_14_0_10_44_13]|nr:MAG: hypothetical protein COV19_01130 [Candidatus Woesearchaeota archaeon CG10_big_fil_rev_8_21_14_0_10_44_13]
MPEISPEDLKNMTPEQIAELQKQNCIFCHIISGKVASKKIFEDDKCIAIMDINPANPGHILLMPKEHYAIMPLIPEDIIGHLFMVAKGLSHASLRALKVEGTNIFVANGVAAGQKAQHFMIHVVPRKEKDGLNCFMLPKKRVTDDQIDEIRKIMKKRINYVMGIKDSGEEEMPEKKPAGKDEGRQTDAKPEMKKDGKDTGIAGENEDIRKKYEEKEREIEKEENGGQDESKDSGIDLDKITDILGKQMGGK